MQARVSILTPFEFMLITKAYTRGLSRDENESWCENRNFGFRLRTTGNTGIPVKTARKKAEIIFFTSFISESENKILTLFQKGEFNILLSLSEINAEKKFFLLSSWQF